MTGMHTNEQKQTCSYDLHVYHYDRNIQTEKKYVMLYMFLS